MRAASQLLAGALLAAGLAAHAADTGNLSVGAVVLSKNNCRITTGAATLDFGTIAPVSTANATASVTLGFRCNGASPSATYSFTAGNGLHSSAPGARRVRHAATPTEFMAYSLSLTPANGTVPKGSDQVLTITGTIVPGQFQNAISGAYSDTVVLTLDP